MNILVVDDEPLAQQRLIQLLSELDGVNQVDTANNGQQAIQQCQDKKPDILLLDIRMPEMDGLEAASHIAQMDEPPAIIFTTAYDEYALDAFNVNAIDYLLKPVRSLDLASAISKASKLNKAQLTCVKTQQETRKHITAKISGNIKLIPINEIIYFQAEQKYVTVKYLNGETIIEDTLKELQSEFEEYFIRIHRNALVAKQFITGIHRDNQGHAMVMLNANTKDYKLEISRRHLSGVKKLLSVL